MSVRLFSGNGYAVVVSRGPLIVRSFLKILHASVRLRHGLAASVVRKAPPWPVPGGLRTRTGAAAASGEELMRQQHFAAPRGQDGLA